MIPDKPAAQNDTLNLFKKIIPLVRIPAVLFIFGAIVVAVYSLIDYLFLSGIAFPFAELGGAIFMLVLGLIFWFVPDRFIKIAENLHDTAADTGTVETTTASGHYAYRESRVKTAQQSFEAQQHTEGINKSIKIQTDPFGIVLFDSTHRPMRILGGLFGIALGCIIFLVIWLMSDTLGSFEFFFLGGWFCFAFLVMGFVYEVRIKKSMGTVERKIGWFFITFKHRYPLKDFDKVVIVSTFFRSSYDHTRERYHQREPSFKVNLIGDRQLNLFVCSSLLEARETGQAVADYFEYPLIEFTEVNL
jgi:hypothetical protein